MSDSSAAVVYTQPEADPQSVWSIDHGLMTDRPVVNVYIKIDGVDTMILPKEIRVVTINTVQITFSFPTAGVAVIS